MLFQAHLIWPVFPSPLTEDKRCVDTRGHGVTFCLTSYIQESNLILIHFRFNSCWRLNSVGTDQINYPIHLLAAAGKPPNACLWIIGRCSPSIRVPGIFYKCRLLRLTNEVRRKRSWQVWMSFSVCPVSLPISQNRSKSSKKRILLSCIHGAGWNFEPSGQQHGKFSGFTSRCTLRIGNDVQHASDF